MTPLGHASIAVLIGSRMKKQYLLALLAGSLIPDIDFILLPFRFFNSAHRYFTHNVFFLIITGIIMLLILRDIDYKMLLLFLAGGLLHLFLDAILDANPSNGIGIPLFWPFSDVYYSPFNLLKNNTTTYNWNEPVKFLLSLWKIYLIELPFNMATFLVYMKRQKHAI